MRTTLTLEPDVALKLNERMAASRKSMKEVVNEALRIGLSQGGESKRVRFVVKPHALGLRPGIDPDKLNQLLDETDVADFVSKRKP
jgi:hypothetical protein